MVYLSPLKRSLGVSFFSFAFQRLGIRTCCCAQGDSLQDICRTPDATIDEELEPIVREGDATLLLKLPDNLDENFDSRTRKVQLPPTMIREDDTREVLIICFQGVFPCLHALEDEWDFFDDQKACKSLWRKSTRMESPITFRDALEPWNVYPFQAWVDKSLDLVVVS